VGLPQPKVILEKDLLEGSIWPLGRYWWAALNYLAENATTKPSPQTTIDKKDTDL